MNRLLGMAAVFVLAVARTAVAATAAIPTFSPASGTYNAPQTVTISDATPGAKIYYTTDGSAPTTSSTLYTGPITISSSKTVKAIAAATGYTKSAVGSATYTLQVAIPTFSPAAGTYGSAQSVTISDATAGATIYYTTDGTTPTTSSTRYGGPVAVSTTTTVKAIAAASGYSNSTVGSSTYTMQAATPTFTPAAGTYGSPQSVSISDATPGAQIYFTTDGTTPTTSSTPYTGPVQVRATTTLQAIAAATGYSSSAIAVASYTITPYLTSITVTAPSTTIYVGSSLQCVATGTYSDGGAFDITTQVAWTTSDPGVAAINGTGLLSGAGGGTTSVAATQGTTAGSLTVTVQAQQAAYYCYDFQGRLTARLPCPVGQDCSTSCPR